MKKSNKNKSELVKLAKTLTTQSEGWEITGHSLPVRKKNVHMQKAKTEKHKGMDGKSSVYSKVKNSSSESIWLGQEVAMIQDEEEVRLNKVMGLNDKWSTLLTVMVWDMKWFKGRMVSKRFGFNNAKWVKIHKGWQ